MSARQFSHPNIGKQARIEQYDREVHLIFVCDTRAAADSLVDDLLRQLKDGALNLTLMGTPTSVKES